MNTKRHELTDIQWKILAPYLPKDSPNGGRPWKDHRQVLNGIFWKLNTGAPWQALAGYSRAVRTLADRLRPL